MELKILVVCAHPGILETIIRLINSQPGWIADGARSTQEAFEKFSLSKFRIVLIGSGIDDQATNIISTELKKVDARIKIVNHYGGGSGLLFGEIHEALKD